MNFTYPFYAYIIVYAAIMLLYFIINRLLMISINRITPAEVLKTENDIDPRVYSSKKSSICCSGVLTINNGAVFLCRHLNKSHHLALCEMLKHYIKNVAYIGKIKSFNVIVDTHSVKFAYALL